MQKGLAKDLNRSEEVVLVTIALNPEVSGEEMVDELDTSGKLFSKCLDTLLQKGYVELAEEEDENCWRITELGQLALNKFRVNMKFDLIYAQKTDEKPDIIKGLRKRKRRFEAAYNVSKTRREKREE